MAGTTSQMLRDMLTHPDPEVFERGWTELDRMAVDDSTWRARVLGEDWETEGRYLFDDLPCCSFGPRWGDGHWLDAVSGEVKVRLALRILASKVARGEDVSHIGRLVLSYGRLSDLNTAGLLTALPGLRSVRLNGNPMRQVPADLRPLTALQCLVMQATQLTSVPSWIGELGGLVHLHLEGEFTTLPASIGDLRHLKTLSVRRELRSLPDEVCALQQLRHLDLSRNHALERLPTDLGRLRLASLDVSDTALQSLPADLPTLKIRYRDLARLWPDMTPQAACVHLDIMDSCDPGIIEKLPSFPALRSLKLERTDRDSRLVVDEIKARYPQLEVQAGVSLNYFTDVMCNPWDLDD